MDHDQEDQDHDQEEVTQGISLHVSWILKWYQSYFCPSKLKGSWGCM